MYFSSFPIFCFGLFMYQPFFLVASMPRVTFFRKKVKTHLHYKFTNVFLISLSSIFYVLNLIPVLFIVICFVWRHFLDFPFTYSSSIIFVFLSNLTLIFLLIFFFMISLFQIKLVGY